MLATFAIGTIGGMVALSIALPDRGIAVSPPDAVAAPAPAAEPSAAEGEPVGGDPAPGGAGGDAAQDVPADAAPAPAPEALPQAPETASPAATPTAAEPAAPAQPSEPQPLEIAIDAVGHQAEIDACLWVRIDFVTVDAPLVGAHNYCGGHVVLDLRAGDEVVLRGFELDGRYVVTGDREVVTGEVAAVATEGLVADVILQTCYWDTGTTRLVTLARLPAPSA